MPVPVTATATRSDPADVHWRSDALTAALGLDRDRARAWTLARVLQDCLWEIADTRPPDPRRLETARLLRI